MVFGAPVSSSVPIMSISPSDFLTNSRGGFFSSCGLALFHFPTNLLSIFESFASKIGSLKPTKQEAKKNAERTKKQIFENFLNICFKLSRIAHLPQRIDEIFLAVEKVLFDLKTARLRQIFNHFRAVLLRNLHKNRLPRAEPEGLV